MLKRQACAKFQSQIFDESEVIQILKVVRWHFCQVYTCKSDFATIVNLDLTIYNSKTHSVISSIKVGSLSTVRLLFLTKVFA